jgi:hypothetical protein
LDDLILQGGNRQRSLPAVRLGNVHPSGRQCPVRSSLDPIVQVLDIVFVVYFVVLPRQPIHSWRSVLLELVERLLQELDVDVVIERGEPLLLPLPRYFPYAFQRL